MKSRRRDETRWSDHTALVAASVALPVTAASAATTIAFGSLSTLGAMLSVAVPGAIAVFATAIAVHFQLIKRHRDRERVGNRRLSVTKRELHDEKQERAVLREVDRALDNAASEQTAIEVIREAFTKHLSLQPMELHLVDAIDPVLELTVATGDHQAKPSVRSSPWDSLAARTSTTLVYNTTERLDVCPHLKSRLHTAMSGIAVPINVSGNLLGVLYGLGPDGQQPGAGDVKFLEDLSRIIGSRLAVLRAASNNITTASEVDKLTGLPDRTAMQDRLLRMLRDRQPFTVAVADIDHFGQLNETQGREVGDRALQLLARVARKAVRPGDIIGRIGGDEFLFVLPHTSPDDATRAFERLREELVLGQATVAEHSFTLSIGVIGSSSGGTIEEILSRAAGALDHAKTQGGNRVVVAHTARPATPGT
ncbi:MAG: diguanylate cyclase (GGDEF)-like protein [Candidatus Aldehydirespiratoraceae bacterium]|jgi:diguanylate cyclase (GGDEF)-like protein